MPGAAPALSSRQMYDAVTWADAASSAWVMPRDTRNSRRRAANR